MALGLQNGAQRAAGGAATRQNGRVAPLAPKHAAGRTRRALKCQAAMTTLARSTSYMGQRVALSHGCVARRSRVQVKSKAMFERFTEKAIKVVMLAQEEARRLGHNFVGTEQILLGLIGESTGIAAKVLKSMGVNLKDARVEVEKIIGRGSGFVAVEIPFTPRAKRVLELSLEEARQLGEFSCYRFASATPRAVLRGCCAEMQAMCILRLDRQSACLFGSLPAHGFLCS